MKPVRRLPPMMSMHNLDMLKHATKRIPLLIRDAISSSNTPSQSRPESPDQYQRYLIGSAPHGFLCPSSAKINKNTYHQDVTSTITPMDSSSGADSTTNLMKKRSNNKLSECLPMPHEAHSHLPTACSSEITNAGGAGGSGSDSPCQNGNHTEIRGKAALEIDSVSNDYVEHWMSDQNNDFGEELLVNQVLSSSACQLSMLDETNLNNGTSLCSPAEPLMPIIDMQTIIETASVGNLSEVEVSQEIQNIFNPDCSELEKRVAFEPVV